MITKKLYPFLIVLILAVNTFAQAPEMMSYQAVVRGVDNKLVANQAVGMQISILQTSAVGTAIYIETHTPIANANGLVTLQIGLGTVVSGDFTTIDWSIDDHFIKTETDPTGGRSYTIMGTSQLLSVPYALYAKTAESVTNDQVDDADNDPNNEIETWLTLAGIPTDLLDGDDVNDADSDATNELQTLSSVLIMSNDASDVQIKNIADATDEQDAMTKKQVDVLILSIAPICKLKNLGYSLQDIYHIGNRTVDEIYTARATSSDTSSCFSLIEMIDLGIPVVEFINSGIPMVDIIESGADLNDVLSNGVTPVQLYDIYEKRVVDMLVGGISLDQMVNGGLPLLTVQEDSTITSYIAAGATAADIFKHNIKINACNSNLCNTGYIEKYYALKFLIAQGYTSTQLLTKVSQIDLFHYTEVPISEIYTVNAATIPNILQLTYGIETPIYISVSDLLARGVPASLITSANLTPQQQIDLAIQIRLNNGETPLAIFQSDNSLEASIYGKIYKGGYIVYFDQNNSAGTVVGKGFHANIPDVLNPSYFYREHSTLSGYRRAFENSIGQALDHTLALAANAAANGEELNAAKFCLDYQQDGGGFNEWHLPTPQDAIDFLNNYWSKPHISNLVHSTAYTNMMHSAQIGNDRTMRTLTTQAQDRTGKGLWIGDYVVARENVGKVYPTKNW